MKSQRDRVLVTYLKKRYQARCPSIQGNLRLHFVHLTGGREIAATQKKNFSRLIETFSLDPLIRGASEEDFSAA